MSPIGYPIETSLGNNDIVGSCAYGAIRVTPEMSASPTLMMRESISPGPSPPPVTSAHEHEQAEHQGRVDRR